MRKQDVELAKKIVRHTTAWRLKHILYKATGEDLRVWCMDKCGDCFHATEIIPLFIYPYNTLIIYDSEIKKCVLCIF